MLIIVIPLSTFKRSLLDVIGTLDVLNTVLIWKEKCYNISN